MADKIVQLQSKDGDNLFPISAGPAVHLYMHIYGYGPADIGRMNATWRMFSTSPTPYTYGEMAAWLYDNGFRDNSQIYEASGVCNWYTNYVADTSGGSPTTARVIDVASRGIISPDGVNMRVLGHGSSYFTIKNNPTGTDWGLLFGGTIQLF